jgi:hypothetical protein
LAVAGDESLWRAGNLDIISLVSLKRAFSTVFKDRASLFTTYEPDEAFTYASASTGADNLINVLYTGARNRLVTAATNAAHGATVVTLRVRSGAEYVYTREIVSHLTGVGRFRQTVRQNVVPMRYPDAYAKVEKDYRSIFYNLTETNVVSNALVDLITSTDDRDGSNYVEWYERLFAMAFAAHTGCQPRNAAGGLRPVPGLPVGAPAGAVPQWYALFPNAQGFTVMMGIRTANNIARPAIPNYPDPQPIDGVSGCTIMPFRRFTNLVTPPVDLAAAAGPRDWRVALYHCTRGYLDMESPPTLCAAGAARTDANVANTSPYLTCYPATLPPITFLTNEIDVGRAGVYNVNALTNPQSAMDAIAFLLQNYGGHADAMTAFSNVMRRTGRFFPAEVTVLPSPMRVRTTNGDAFLRTIRRRLVYLRCVRPIFGLVSQGAALRSDPEAVKDLKIWNASPPAGIDLTRAVAAGAQGAAALAVFAGAYAFPGFAVANLPAHAYQNANPFAGAVNMRNDLAWHNYFANVAIDGTDNDPLFDFIETMPADALDNARLWVDGAFAVGAWANAGGAAPTAAMLAAAADWRIEITDRAGGAIAQADRSEALAYGVEFRADRILPLTNFIEVRQAAVPFGARLLRSIRSAQAMYHSDTIALTLADRLIHSQFSTIFDIGVLLQVQMRAGVDMLAGQLQLSPSAMSLADGRPMVGNVDLDRELSTTNDYIDMVGLQSLVTSFCTGVGEAIGSIGLPTTWATELSTGTTVEIMPYHLWHYTTIPGAPDLETCQLALRTLSPVTAAMFRPELNTPGSVVVDKPKIFSTLSPTSLLPWDEWAIDSGQFKETEPFGVLRCVMALSGQRIVVSPGLRQVHMSGNADPITRPILTRYGRVGPRVPWQTPTMENSIIEPFWFVAAPLGFQIRAIPAGDVYDFLAPGPMHAYQYNARPTNLPPLNVYNDDMITHLAGTNAVPRPVSGYTMAIGGWGAGNYARTRRLALAGTRHMGPGLPALNADHTTTPYGESIIRVLSGQASSNTTWMRNTPALEQANSATRTMFSDRTRAIVGADGNAPPAGWIPVGAASEGIRLTSYGANLHTVPFGDEVPPPEQMTYVVMQSPTWSMRWRTWYCNIKPGALPILLAPLEQYAAGLNVPILTGLPSIGLSNAPPLPAQASLSRALRARMGLPLEGVDNPPVQTFDPLLTNIAAQRLDTRHINTGYSAVNGAFNKEDGNGYPPRPLMTYDPEIEARRLEEQIALLRGEGLPSRRSGRTMLQALRPQAGF